MSLGMLSRHLNLLTEDKTIDIVQRGVPGLAGFSPSGTLFQIDIGFIGPPLPGLTWRFEVESRVSRSIGR
jgi:hypothetical protein